MNIILHTIIVEFGVDVYADGFQRTVARGSTDTVFVYKKKCHMVTLHARSTYVL